MIQHYNNETDLNFLLEKGEICVEIDDHFSDLESEAEPGASGEEETGELVCEQASMSSNKTTFYAQMIVVARFSNLICNILFIIFLIC